MKYSYEFKMEAVELYKKDKWIDTPDSVSCLANFRSEICKWVRRYDLCESEALRYKT